MALFFADLVREASWGVGAGDLALGGALPGHRRFAEAVPPGARFHYAICGVTHPDEWETGEGAIGEDGALVRTPIASSAGDAAVDFAAGLKTVALTVAAAWFAAREADPGDPAALAAKADLAGADFTGPVSAPSLALGAPLAVAAGGTGAADAAAARAALGLAIGADVEAHDPKLTALAGLDAAPGLIEQTGAASFAKRTIGAGAAGDLLSRADGDARYQPLDAELGALAALASAADRLPYFNGAGSAALATFTAAGRALIDDADAAAQRATLGLGTAATQSTGTSGANVPLLNAANSWGASQSVAGDIIVTGNFFGPSGGFTIGAASDGVRVFASTHSVDITTNSVSNRFTVDSAGVCKYGSLEIGFRDNPRVTAGLERGKCLATSAGVTIAAGSAAGSTYTIYNDSSASITLTQGSGLTLRLAGTATTGNRTLAARGFATIWFNAAGEAIVSGAGVA